MQTVLLIITIALALWTIFLSWLVLRVWNVFNRLGRVKGNSLSEVLSRLLKNQNASKKEFSEVYREIARIDREKSYLIKSVGFVRFNPFGKEELEQSFTLALLNNFGDGVLITSINTREFTRTYAKEITRGKSKNELSVEEKKAIQLALKI